MMRRGLSRIALTAFGLQIRIVLAGDGKSITWLLARFRVITDSSEIAFDGECIAMNKIITKNNNNFEAINSVFDFQEWLSNHIHASTTC